MKKILSLIMCLAMILTACCVSFSVFASDPAVKINVASAYAKAGDTVALDAMVTNNPGFMSAVFSVKVVDGTGATATEITATVENGGIFYDSELEIGKNILIIADSDVTNTGKLFTINLALGSDVAPGTYTVQLIPRDVVNYDEDNVSCNVVNGTLTVAQTNSDGVLFSGASLTLEDNIAVNYKVDPSQFEGTGYSDPYVVFSFNGKQFVVTEHTLDTRGRYAYTFSDIAPRMMNDSIVATLYATYEGNLVACHTRSYSVKEYCYNMLARCNEGEPYANDADFKALLVDLLNYGEAAQIYGDYKVNTLVTADLTATQKTWATVATPTLSTVQNLTYKTIENPSATWKAGGLLLEDAVTMRFKFDVDSIDGLTVKFYTDARPSGWTVDSSAFVKTSGGYYVYFDGLRARQMRETVYVTVYRGNTAISNTVSYSIESYAYAKQNDSDALLTALLEAMMKYGDSAYKYING